MPLEIMIPPRQLFFHLRVCYIQSTDNWPSYATKTLVCVCNTSCVSLANVILFSRSLNKTQLSKETDLVNSWFSSVRSLDMTQLFVHLRTPVDFRLSTIICDQLCFQKKKNRGKALFVNSTISSSCDKFAFAGNFAVMVLHIWQLSHWVN